MVLWFTIKTCVMVRKKSHSSASGPLISLEMYFSFEMYFCRVNGSLFFFSFHFQNLFHSFRC